MLCLRGELPRRGALRAPLLLRRGLAAHHIGVPVTTSKLGRCSQRTLLRTCDEAPRQRCGVPTQCYAMLCYAMLCCAVLCYAMQDAGVRCSRCGHVPSLALDELFGTGWACNVIATPPLCRIYAHSTISHRDDTLCCAVLCCALLCCALFCFSVLFVSSNRCE
mgnify:CR=1 FL=1